MQRQIRTMQDKRGYQFGFSKTYAGTTYDRRGRERKAKTMVAVLKDFFQSDLNAFSVLDVGSSTGFISHYLSDYFQKVVGIDIDKPAVEFARNRFEKKNLDFIPCDAMDIDFPDRVFLL